MITKRTSLLLALISMGLLILIPARLIKHRGLPASEGILNFGRVNSSLYRGAQPDEQGMRNLAKLGVKTIISLRKPGEISQSEQQQAMACGITYTNLPLGGFGRPTGQQMAGILNVIETFPGPVFVHCEHGCDRTGTIIACYRIKHDQWTCDDALKEAGRYGMSGFERGMKAFVIDFAKAGK